MHRRGARFLIAVTVAWTIPGCGAGAPPATTPPPPPPPIVEPPPEPEAEPTASAQRILQFQFHRALCKAAGHEGPLDQCSIFGSKEAGSKLRAMLQLGASKPWPEALAVLGEERMDAQALIDYFAPLHAHLKKENAGQTCGW